MRFDIGSRSAAAIAACGMTLAMAAPGEANREIAAMVKEV